MNFKIWRIIRRRAKTTCLGNDFDFKILPGLTMTELGNAVDLAGLWFACELDGPELLRSPAFAFGNWRESKWPREMTAVSRAQTLRNGSEFKGAGVRVHAETPSAFRRMI